MGIEFELKFRADEKSLEALRQSVEGSERLYQMHTTYYDTPSGALSQRHYTLRRRMENEISVCTLKCPATDGGRGEFETQCRSIEEALPILCKLSGLPELPTLLSEGIQPICSARFTRIAKTFCWQGTTMELALDRGVLCGGSRSMPLCEAELELKEGSRDAVVAYATLLAAAHGLQQEHRSKFRRALDLAKEE